MRSKNIELYGGISAEELEYELLTIALEKGSEDRAALRFATSILNSMYRSRLLEDGKIVEIENVNIHILPLEQIQYIAEHSLETVNERRGRPLRNVGNVQWGALVTAIHRLLSD